MELNAGSLSPEALFKMAQGLPDNRLAAILAGRDNAVPQFVAQAVLSERQRIRQAQAGQQAQAQMAQQPRSKKEELLAGVASVAPDNIAQMAGGGIVAFSGESGDQEVKSREAGDREAILSTLGFSGRLLKDIASLPGRAVAGAAEYAVTRPLRALGVPVPYLPASFYGGDPEKAFPYSGLFDSAPASPKEETPYRNEGHTRPAPPAAVAPTAPTAPTRSVGGGGGGGGRAAAPAAAAPAAAAPEFDTKKYFPDLKQPSYVLGDLSSTNPYAKPKTADEYIAEADALRKKYGVEENPYKEREAELRAAQAGEAEKRRMAGLSGLANFGLMMAGSGARSVGQAAGLAGQRAMQKYETDIKELDAAREKRAEALQGIRVAQNQIKEGRVKEGIAKLETDTKNFNEADIKFQELKAARDADRARVAAQIFQTETQYGTAAGQARAAYDLKIKELAQQLKISEAQLKADYAKIDAMRATGGPRTPAEIQLIERLISDPKFAAGYREMMSLKKPEDAVTAFMRGNIGGGGVPPRPDNAVQPSR